MPQLIEDTAELDVILARNADPVEVWRADYAQPQNGHDELWHAVIIRAPGKLIVTLYAPGRLLSTTELVYLPEIRAWLGLGTGRSIVAGRPIVFKRDTHAENALETASRRGQGIARVH